MLGRISSPLLVGRAAELEALERLLARAASGSGRAVLVSGEAGIGKSRLVSELEERARAREVRVLVGECVELAGGELAFAPIISALREVVEEPSALEWLAPRQRSALAALWPGLGDVGEEAGEREQLFEAVYRVLSRSAEEAPVLLIVEDVHWIDPSSRDLLAFLIRNARHDPIALLVTYRSDELQRGHPLLPFVTELERSGRAERVDLGPLTRSEVAQQLQAIAGSAPTGDVVDGIFGRSEGNPFYAEELLAGVESGSAELPGSLREALLLRLETLSDLTQEVLRAAAVVGRSVDHRLLAAVVDVDERELHGALREAVDFHVLVASAGETAYVFRHALLREAIYDDALLGERLRLHRAIAATLDGHREYARMGATAQLAHHWLAAGDDRAALAASVEAATEAASMRAHGEAARHIDRALELWDRVPDPEAAAGTDAIELMLSGSELADFSGDAEHGLALAERARAEIDEAREPLRAARAEARIGRSLHFAARGADALEHLAEARRLVPRDPPSVAYAEALAYEGRALMLNGRPRDALERFEEALPISKQVGARKAEASVLNSMAITYSDVGQFERAIAFGREGLALSLEIGSAEEITRAYINGSQAIEDAGRIEEAHAMGNEGIELGDRLGMSRVAGDQLRCQNVMRLIRLGRLADAEVMIEPTLGNATTSFNVAASNLAGGRVALEQGRLDLAQERLDRAWPLMQRSGGFQLIGPAITARVLLELRRGDLLRARELAREGLEQAVLAEGHMLYNTELFWAAVRVEAELAERTRMAGDKAAEEECKRIAASVVDSFREGIASLLSGRPPPEALAFETLARAELTRVHDERDPEPWLAASEAFREIGAAYPAAYADFRAAEALAISGARVAEISVPLKAAHGTAVLAGSQPFLMEVMALARRARVDLEAAAEESSSGIVEELGLTARELEVLRLVADGRTNRQIGEELFITEKTASVHVSRILMKLGVANRAQAGATAHRLGLSRPLEAESKT